MRHCLCNQETASIKRYHICGKGILILRSKIRGILILYGKHVAPMTDLRIVTTKHYCVASLGYKISSKYYCVRCQAVHYTGTKFCFGLCALAWFDILSPFCGWVLPENTPGYLKNKCHNLHPTYTIYAYLVHIQRWFGGHIFHPRCPLVRILLFQVFRHNLTLGPMTPWPYMTDIVMN